MADESSQQGSAAVLEPDVAPPQRKPMPGWAVLLHNDDVNEFVFVARSVVEFARLTAAEAAERTVEAHESGVALLLVTHRERAELIQEQFQTRGLTVTIEPAA
ncbi:MAG: ATP-dependent Clp protease adaptor ClpS [Actinobacteria bacterium]|jgi:ATP-dependent Clp protease adapter protein ClpS|nr:ATP-dependent Clp protease adaptor ClpS [Actinomycetota bacterium]